jgi:hypothetical protein
MTISAAATKSIGLPADAHVVMVFSTPFINFTLTRKLMPVNRDFAKTTPSADTDGNSPYHRADIIILRYVSS